MNDFVIKAARTQDFAALVRIEIDAAGLFPADVLPVSARGVLTSEELQAALKYSCLWVAELVEGEVIGFILAEEYERSLHVKEMDVAPAYMRGGVGTRRWASPSAWRPRRRMAVARICHRRASSQPIQASAKSPSPHRFGLFAV